MGKAFNILDKRITERLAKSYGGAIQTITTSGEETLARMVQRASIQMEHLAPISTLRIFAHGLYSTVGGQVTTATSGNVSGGFGVQMCKEGLLATTVSQLAPLKVHLDPEGKVMVYACGAAAVAGATYCSPGSQVGNILSPGNGAYLMDQLSKTLGVPVYASDAEQIFNTLYYSPHFFGDTTTFADFGPWEGKVYQFDGAGNQVDITATAPTH